MKIEKCSCLNYLNNMHIDLLKLIGYWKGPDLNDSVSGDIQMRINE